MNHIELDRKFKEISNSEITQYSNDLEAYLSNTVTINYKSWDDLLTLDRVVIIAKAGAGKTEEIKYISNKLIAQNEFSFFLRLEDITPGDGFELAFESQNFDEFQEWLNNESVGYFFLDSVDEAKLKDYNQFNIAIKLLATKIQNKKEKSKIYITTRPSDWSDEYDLNIVQSLLNVTTREKVIQGQEATARQKPGLKTLIFGLCSLTKEQITTFLTQSKVKNTNSLIEQINLKYEDLILDTPKDLLDVISFWNDKGNLSSKVEMINFNIKNSLIEEDPNRNSKLIISHEKINQGAKLLAASATLIKKNKFSTLDKVEPYEVNNVINTSVLLNEWNQQEIKSLLTKKVFEKEIYNTVRFDHRSIREVLTAQWIVKILENSCSREAIERIFIRRIYSRDVLVESMVPILSWVVPHDQILLEKTIQINPIVLLKHGDASQFTIDTKVKIIDALVLYTEKYHFEPISFSSHEALRFSSKGLIDAILRHLKCYKKLNGTALRLLFSLVEIEKLSCMICFIVRIAKDSTISEYTRRKAISVIASCGEFEHKQEIINHYTKELGDENLEIYGSVITSFWPNDLPTEKAILILKHIDGNDHYALTSFDYNFRYFLKEKCPITKGIELLEGMYQLIREEPYIDSFCKVSINNSWLLSYALPIIERLIDSNDNKALEEPSIHYIQVIPQAKKYGISRLHIDSSFAEKIHMWDKLNQSLFWNAVSRNRKILEAAGGKLEYWYKAKELGDSWRFQEDSVDYFIEEIKNRPLLDDKKVALSMCIELTKNLKYIEKIKSLISDNQKLSEFYTRLVSNKTEAEKRVNKTKIEDNAYVVEQNLNNKKEIEYVIANRQVLSEFSLASDGKIYELQGLLLRKLRDIDPKGSSKWGLSNWRGLIDIYNEDVANSFYQGCVGYWRNYKPKTFSKTMISNQTTSAVVMGLCGLSFESNENADWTSALNTEEAKTACAYALNEMNGFPVWFEDLYKAFSDDIIEILIDEIKWELTQKEIEYKDYVLYEVVHREKWLAPLLTDKVIELLHEETTNSEVLKESLKLVKSSERFDFRKFIDLANEKLEKNISDDHFFQWLAALMCVKSESFHIQMLEQKLKTFCSDDKDEAYQNKNAVKWVRKFLISLDGSGTNDVSFTQCDYRTKPNILYSLIILIHTYLPSFKDVNRISQGAYSPDERDESQDNRNHLTEYLKRIPGKESYDALIALSKKLPEAKLRKYYEKYARDKAILDADLIKWKEEQLLNLVKTIDPSNQKQSPIVNLNLKIRKACMHLQGNKLYWNTCDENDRNRYISDMLANAEINVKPENPWSKSSKGIRSGEVDIFVSDTSGNPLSIIEALNLNSLKKDYLNIHLDKVFSYDANGLEELYILVYSCASNFNAFWNKYVDHIESHEFEYDLVDYYEVSLASSDMKHGKSTHYRKGTQIHLNHMFLNLKY